MKSAWVCVDFIKSSIKKFRFRWMPDKHALLIFVWNLLLLASILSYSYYVGFCLKLNFPDFKVQLEIVYSRMAGSFIFLLSGLFSAWLIGWKYRLVDIVFTGMIIIGVSFLIGAIPNLITSMTNKCNGLETVVIMIMYCTLANLGMALVFTNFFQLAIEQIPDASSSQLSYLTSWYIFSCICGDWSCTVINGILQCYLTSNSESAHIYLSYFTLVCGIIITFILGTFALIKRKLVDNSPTSNTVSHIYQVVKYAIKHRRPVQRSAMTYWEEEIPRGVDLGKRKYGGPFTSEKVEDVKTFFRLSFLYFIGFIYYISVNISNISMYFVDKKIVGNNYSLAFVEISDNLCTRSAMYKLLENYSLWILISIMFCEVIMKPLLGYKISDMRRRLKLGIFLRFLIFSVTAVIVGIIRYSTANHVNSFWLKVGLSVPLGIANAIVFVTGLEFFLAQTPYAMRNFFMNVGYSVGFFVNNLSELIFVLYYFECKSKYCPIIYCLVSLSLNFVAMLLLWKTITWYRMRSRGQEDEHQQRWIEEVYDRYLEQANN